MQEDSVGFLNEFFPNTKDNPQQKSPGEEIFNFNQETGTNDWFSEQLKDNPQIQIEQEAQQPPQILASTTEKDKPKEIEEQLKVHMQNHPLPNEEKQLMQLLEEVFTSYKVESVDKFIKEVWVAAAHFLDLHCRSQCLYHLSEEYSWLSQFQRPFNRTKTTVKYFMSFHINLYEHLIRTKLRINHEADRDWTVTFDDQFVRILPKKDPDKRKSPNYEYFNREGQKINLFSNRGPRGKVAAGLKKIQPGSRIQQDKDPPQQVDPGEDDSDSVFRAPQEEYDWQLQ